MNVSGKNRGLTCLWDLQLLLQVREITQRRQEARVVRCAVKKLGPEAFDLVGQICEGQHKVKLVIFESDRATLRTKPAPIHAGHYLS